MTRSNSLFLSEIERGQMNRRNFLITAGAAAATANAAPDTSATVLYGDRTVKLDKTRPDPHPASNDLWVRKADLPGINEFEVKPQGACRNDVCIPIPKAMLQGEYFNLTAFANKLGEKYVNDAGSRAWSFGEIPVLTGSYTSSRMAPDFAVADRKGKIVHLSEFKGKKALVVTWASW
jgi:hypothetical protein